MIQQVSARNASQATEDDTENKIFQKILKKHKSVFVLELRDVLPPIRSVDLEISFPSDCTPPYRPLYPLYPAELAATK